MCHRSPHISPPFQTFASHRIDLVRLAWQDLYEFDGQLFLGEAGTNLAQINVDIQVNHAVIFPALSFLIRRESHIASVGLTVVILLLQNAVWRGTL
jgi:hypothetical protein